MFCIFFPCKSIHNKDNRIKQIHFIRHESNISSVLQKWRLFVHVFNPIMQYTQQLLIIDFVVNNKASGNSLL